MCFKIKRAFQLGSAHREEGAAFSPSCPCSYQPFGSSRGLCGAAGQSGERPGHAGREAGARSRGQSLGSSCHKGAERGAARSGVEKQRPSVSSRVPSAGPLIFGTSDGVPDRPKHGAVWVPKSTSDRLQPSHLFRLGKVVVFFGVFFGGAVMRTMFPGRVPEKTTLSSSLSASVCLC